MFARIKQEAILESWGTLVGSVSGRSEEFFRKTGEAINSYKVPFLVMDYKEVAPSFEKGLFGKKRPAIIVTNRKMPEYKMFIMCRDYGTQLSISWYLLSASPLMYAITTFAQTLAQTKKPMDVFQLEELSCWTATVHHATTAASKEIAESVGFDFSKVDQKSRGFLNIS
ncbi:MAG: hypothetical protein WCX77_01205 [Candidatus Paceibacterota bacterium]|jgi:hypothetical protein